jgi:hypothetical protein
MSKEQDNKAIVGRWFAGFWSNPWNPAIVDELQRIIRSGLVSQEALPDLPVALQPVAMADPTGGRRHNRRREVRPGSPSQEDPIT